MSASELSLAAIESATGAICVLALDHRDAMRNAFLRAGVEGVTAEEVVELKARIVEALAPSASGVLLDEQAAGACPLDGLGLLVPLEQQGHEPLDGTRLNRLEFSAVDARRLGADGCKLLLYYRADHGASAARQRELVARAAADCHRLGLPLALEPLVYRLADESEDAYRGVFAELVIAGARDLAGSGADLLKLQYPGDAGSCARLTAAAAPLRWVLLGGSEVDADRLAVQLETACDAGASGFMVGRAIWGGALGLPAADQAAWLAAQARPRFERLVAIAERQ
jgi:tagatose 1,6-diphosphate aldolase